MDNRGKVLIYFYISGQSIPLELQFESTDKTIGLTLPLPENNENPDQKWCYPAKLEAEAVVNEIIRQNHLSLMDENGLVKLADLID